MPGAGQRAVHWCPGRLARAAWKTFGWPPFERFAGKADLYHFPNFVLPPLGAGRSVVTIHDLSFLRFPDFAEKRNLAYLSARIPDTVRRADAILTDSLFSAGEICERLNADPERVFAVHLGIDERFAPPPAGKIQAVRRELGLDRPYLLTVGTLEPRKNVPFLVDVFENLPDFDGDLVVAGRRGWKDGPILERLHESSRAGRIRVLEDVDDGQLPALYAGASLFVLASFYEGFGFPPLEAMACGTPVLSSAGGSLPEVLGNAAIVLNSFDADLWSGEARRILSDTALRTSLVERGRARAAAYNWERTAAETWAVYRKVTA